VLGQVKVDDKFNEITATLKLLESLNIAGYVVRRHGQPKENRRTDHIYALSLKGNQGCLRGDVDTFFKSSLVLPSASGSM
jgi:predicted transposase YbfD/YdcC